MTTHGGTREGLEAPTEICAPSGCAIEPRTPKDRVSRSKGPRRGAVRDLAGGLAG